MKDSRRAILELCALRVDGSSVDWNLISREVDRVGSPELLLRGTIVEQSRTADRSLPLLRAGLDYGLAAARERVAVELEAAAAVGARLITILDPDYPANLRLVKDRPPFLFVRGSMLDVDVEAVAVVGTRRASTSGLARAARMARLLAKRDVTVVSGLAAGIDTAAHTEALDVGGRTIAVVGTGITRCYPADNADLAERIADDGAGAVVSQFWPTAGPAKWTFPRRNHVTSALAQGTVVIEASSTSGAKMQARIALEQGKKVWLLDSLVTDQPWAATYVDERGAKRTGSVDDVIEDLASTTMVTESVAARQLTLDAM